MNNGNIFQTVEKSRISSEIAKQISKAILEGRIAPGQYLPPERELTQNFNVSRPILREALQLLEVQGYIHIRHGRGALIKDSNKDILNVPLESWLPQNQSLVRQFYEARIAIEPVCSALAAQRANEKDIFTLKAFMDHEDHLTVNDIPVFISIDIDFHLTVAHISGNTFLIQMLKSLITPETDIRKIILRLPNHLPTTHQDHFAVFQAIERHDSEAAKNAMIIALSRPLEVVTEFMNALEKSR